MKVTQNADQWIIEFSPEATIEQVCLAKRLEVRVGDGSTWCTVAFASPFELHSTSVSVIDPEQLTTELALLVVQLRDCEVGQCLVNYDGHLSLSLGSGKSILASPDPDFEAWEIGLDGLTLIALPGGSLGVWERSGDLAEEVDLRDLT